MVDKGLYKNGRKGFFIGGNFDTSSTRDAAKTSYSGGNNNNNNNNTGGGGRDYFEPTPVITTLPSNIPAIDTTQPYNPAGTIASTVPMDIKEQYRVGNNISVVPNLGPVTVMDQPYSSLGLEQQRYDNYIAAKNLANRPYEGVNVPSVIPGSTVINTVGNFLGGIGYEKNKNFFAENVAGNYGYGYGLEDYERYMQDRMAGNVNAYGRTLTDFEKGGRDNGGISNIGVQEVQGIDTLTEDQEPEEETPMTDYERYQSYLQNFFGGI